MAEIKTCEQYVLNRLTEMENKNAELEEQVRQLTSDNLHLEEDYVMLTDLIKHYSEIRVNEREDGSTHKYISFNGIWENYDTEDFNMFTSLVGYSAEEEEDKNGSTSD